MRYSFHPEAQSEFMLAIDYCENREKTLGYQFAIEVFAAVERAAAHPALWPFIDSSIRRISRTPAPWLPISSEQLTS